MIVVESELSDLGSKAGICDQCGNFMYGRHITGGESLFFAGSRGTFFICFDCVAPVVCWKKTYGRGTIYKTPVNRLEYEDALTKLGGRPNPRLESDAADGAAQPR